MACQFSKNGKYFAQITTEGKLKIWNTFTNTFEQEFTPDFQLTSPCTCLNFVCSDTTSKLGSPRKKKRRDSTNESNISVALGTTSGRLLIYSLTKADLDYVIDSNTSQSINCLSSSCDEFIYSGTDTNILIWNLYKRNISSKWLTGNDKVAAISVLPNSDQLLTASKSIKLWSITSKEVLKTFTGHSSQVTLLYYVNIGQSDADTYVISGSKGDRLLNCWNINESSDGKNAMASFLMEDIVHNLSVNIGSDGTTSIAATVRSGVVHVYHHTFNGKKCNKPVKPKTTVQVVSDSQENGVVSPMYITAATHRDFETLCICYGSALVQTFEDTKISGYKKLQCLLREDIHKKRAMEKMQSSKVRAPVVGNDVHYLSSQTSSLPTKRKNDGQQEVPMEKRLENLMVNEDDSSSKVPKANNAAQLLIQGLHSKDKNMLRTVLFKKDEELIKNTVKRIPVTVIAPLLEELTKLIQGKTLSRQISLKWLKNVILIHSGVLLANPDLSTYFGEALASIEAGLALQTPRNRLMGRLELLMSQITHVVSHESPDNEALLVFNDKVSDSDNDSHQLAEDSSSDEWEEENSEDDDKNENENDSDEPMSS